MNYIADFHIHSKYSRATSKQMDLEHLNQWAKIKGIQILGTGDFTHPAWFKELKEKLIPVNKGIYQLKSEIRNSSFGSRSGRPELVERAKFEANSKFILTTEISCIYTKNNKIRRIHLLVLAPDLETVEKINQKLKSDNFNLTSDGRPILGLDAKELMKILLDISQDIFIIPAHIWTPWYSLFGSKSGFDSIEECFEELTPYIFALETGLSADPLMCWHWSYLDNYTLISNSDAHSLENLGREANVFEFNKEPNYFEIIGAIKDNALSQRLATSPISLCKSALDFCPRESAFSPRQSALVSTIEFFPEEGKYHFDGHRLCGVRFSPEETKKEKGICPKCHKPLTLGVMYRVKKLADRTESKKPQNAPNYRSIIPLKEILAEVLETNSQSKAVAIIYENLIKKAGNEFNILLNLTEEELTKICEPKLVEAILKMRNGEVIKEPGYDGVYGKIKIFPSTTEFQSRYEYANGHEHLNRRKKDPRQKSLF